MKLRRRPDSSRKADQLILIGQISVYFGWLILSLRHFYIYPANQYGLLTAIMLIGFLPSLSYKLLPPRVTAYLLVGNALAIVSLVFIILKEWALAGVFVLVPVFSLLFQRRRIYALSSACSLALTIVLSLLFLFDASQANIQLVILLDVLTVFLVLVFIIYFVVKDLRWHYMAEARRMQTIQALSHSVEAKDPYTQGHSERVADLGALIAERLSDLDRETVYNCGLIHDVGKLSISDTILLKASRLTDEEFHTMKAHTTVGAKLCQNLEVPEEIVHGVLHHHERWDGGGYPYGLKGEAIPLIGRVLCVADSIDAMCSNRAYRRALGLDVVLEEVKRGEGAQFDPAIVRIVLDRWTEVEAYYREGAERSGGRVSQTRPLLEG